MLYNDGSTPENYKCAICGDTGVKLWRPYMDDSPLICASCAEERQSARTYNPIEKWGKGTSLNGETCWIGTFLRKSDENGNMVMVNFPMPRWTVNEEGCIPSSDGFGPEGEWLSNTDQLSVDLVDVSESYSSGSISMVPAVPTEDGEMWGYTSVPEEGCVWWKKLPTHRTE